MNPSLTTKRRLKKKINGGKINGGCRNNSFGIYAAKKNGISYNAGSLS
jgi:hypothetical protein